MAKEHITTKGGGWWEIKGNDLFLYGSSIEFGRAKLGDIIDAIEKQQEISNRTKGIISAYLMKNSQ